MSRSTFRRALAKPLISLAPPINPGEERMQREHYHHAPSGRLGALQPKVVSRTTRQAPRRYDQMTTFNEREQGFEKKFALDSELKFKAESRRNKAVAEWAGAKLGLSDEQLQNYIKEVRKADLAEAGDDDVFRKLKSDFAAKGVAIDDAEIRSVMASALAKAVTDLESSKD
jgi:hypothetical protein